jgi:uncharacterized membrane protein
VAATIVGALLLVAPSTELTGTTAAPTFRFGRAVAYILFNVYAIKMAGVFMISTSTVVIYTGIAPRWMAWIGYALAALVLLGSFYLSWSIMVLPAWVLLLSVHILIENLRGRDSGTRQPERQTEEDHCARRTGTPSVRCAGDRPPASGP